jgi:dTDP-glucose pyrophosphorylase
MITRPTTIVVPMAGRGSRFADAGFALPKPLIDIDGHAMIELVIANLRPSEDHRFVFIAQRDHDRDHDLASRLQRWAPGSALVLLDGVTEGAACTVLTAAEHIDPDAPLMIANSDQWVDLDIDDYLAAHRASGHDGFIMTMTATDPKWSFVRFDDDGRVCGVVEKVPVSDVATVGIYNFARGSQFLDAARAMIAADKRVNGEFYVAPCYDELLAAGGTVGVYGVGTDTEGMYGLGTPADLAHFCSLPVRDKAVEKARRALVG